MNNEIDTQTKLELKMSLLNWVIQLKPDAKPETHINNAEKYYGFISGNRNSNIRKVQNVPNNKKLGK